MNALISLGNRILNLSHSWTWLPPLLARITVGVVFFQSGLGKVNNLERVTGYFASLGLPAPAFQAMLVGWSELIAGLLLILGLATRLATIPLTIIMIVAIRTALSEDVTDFSSLAGATEYLYIVLMVWLMVAGPGKVALDALVAKRFRSK